MNITPKDKLLNLDNKVAIVTGSTVGIGYGIAYRLAEAGAKVVVTGRDPEEGKKAEEELVAKGYKVKFIKVDVSIEEEVKVLINETIKAFGQINILVNNAGIFPFKLLAQMTTADFEMVIDTNLKGVFLMTKYVSDEMIKKGQGGKIINVTSIDALHPSAAGLAHYDASKHGVWGIYKKCCPRVGKK
jgi:2-deoxy-D-gluconate 3-dehydrogenase